MIEFVNLNESEDTGELIIHKADYVDDANDYKQVEEFIINQPEFEEPKEDSLCVPSCEEVHGGNCNQDASGYFAIEKLFSELSTEYQKLLARRNLGIGDEYTFKWGAITGSLVNQKDLTIFIQEQLQKESSVINKSIDQKIKDLLNNIDSQNKTTVYYGPNLNNLQFTNQFTFTTESYPEYIYVCTPRIDTQFEVSGLKGGFEYLSEINISGKTFYVFKSTNSKLGVTKITLQYGNVS